MCCEFRLFGALGMGGIGCWIVWLWLAGIDGV